MTDNTSSASTLLAVAECDFHKKVVKFVDLGKAAKLKAYTYLPSDDGQVHIDWSKGRHLVPMAFEDKSSDYYEAWEWVHSMEDSPYTQGMGWRIIPYNQNALEYLARAWNVSAENIAD